MPYYTATRLQTPYKKLGLQRSHGAIGIDVHLGDDSVTVCISDEGEGMTEDVQKHIFEKFYQAHTSRSSEGNGLGLPLVKRILDICGGSVSVKSKPQCGSSFIISLPIEANNDI